MSGQHWNIQRNGCGCSDCKLDCHIYTKRKEITIVSVVARIHSRFNTALLMVTNVECFRTRCGMYGSRTSPDAYIEQASGVRKAPVIHVRESERQSSARNANGPDRQCISLTKLAICHDAVRQQEHKTLWHHNYSSRPVLTSLRGRLSPRLFSISSRLFLGL